MTTERSHACIDAEQLAAWADGALPDAEVAAVRSHAADCARCRALLSSMVRSEPAPPQRASWWRAPLVRWAAPLAAAAGAATIWLMVGGQPGPAGETTGQAQPPAAMADGVSPAPQEAPAAAPPPVTTAPAPAKVAPGQDRQQAAARERAPESRAPSPREERKDTAAARPAPPADAEAPGSLAAMSGRAAAPAPPPVPVLTEIRSPDGATRWRLKPPATIELSTDAGRTWHTHAAVLHATLTAGSSPAASICWIVGTAGTVMRTTDLRTWQRLSPPAAADLVSVSARDADHATVTTVDGLSFATADGGRTWTRLPLQEDSPAPF